ncbi:hypothetical protein T8A63_16350 [Sulfitobacter sp. OXR-159]|uniref:hypothetical protein n=1 Tax=Sulfitobacter sp. OXR-159 TaxID=3100174 RepID=UPI002AC8B2F8|nr:hypothetical protein [Sulfitobacter sp. OXR-159]WPZ29177.1 hypothetical protein T8A63_16350 [Sulfitobacter sp. OXR-159]
MTDQTLITPFLAHKADHSHYPTPLATEFAALLPALARHIEAEREIEDVDIWDPAFRSWLTDAEHAFTDVTTHLSTIASIDLTCSDDKPLKRMSMLIDAMIGSEEPQTFMQFYRLLPRFEHLFYCDGTSLAIRHRNVMLRTARAHIDTMANLLTYDSEATIYVDETLEVPRFA